MDTQTLSRALLILLPVFALACGDDDGVADSGVTDGDVIIDSQAADGAQPDGAWPDGSSDGLDGGTCTDEDDDGHGEGCALGTDCNEDDPAVHASATEACNGTDDDCDGRIDEDSDAPLCPLTVGVCLGARTTCGSDLLICDRAAYGADYEDDETSCDGLDNDCDGSTDEGCTCTDGSMQACGSDEGVCAAGIQVCTDGAWGGCVDDVGPMGESCNGLDDDCDGEADELEDLELPDCPLSLGVCAGSKRECGDSGYIACSGIRSYGGDYERTETLCDGLDNDCDGVVDEGCECTDGATQACGTDLGACVRGVQICASGFFGECAGEVTPDAESCNGNDDDCDGSVDEDVLAPACALTEGVCLGAVQRCGGEAGFDACTAERYGPRYEVSESLCDGLDNDCDGVTDEGCDCTDGQTQECGSSVGACERGTQTCSGGEFGPCIGATGPRPESCNGADDNCNGVTDEGGVCAPPPEASNALCTDGIDNDENGFIDCDDWGCSRNPAVNVCAERTPDLCTDGFDNDGNGFVDCEDFGCSRNPDVRVCNERTIALCTDGFDNDGNGYTDCEDFACSRNPDFMICNELGVDLCTDGLDNDGNGYIDCDDHTCNRDPAVSCAEITDALCSDGLDNDSNGFTDCEDFSCSRNPAISVCD